jgi:hypothetical protein
MGLVVDRNLQVLRKSHHKHFEDTAEKEEWDLSV